MDTTELIPPQKRNRNYWLICLIGLIVCGLVIFGLTVAYNTLIRSDTSSVKNKPAEQQPKSIGAVVATIASNITANFPALQKQTAADATNTVGFPLPGYSFSVLIPYAPEGALSFSDGAGASESAGYAAYQRAVPAVQATLQKAGFTPLKSASATDNSLETILFYQRQGSVCQITSYSLLDISCASKATMNATAKAAQPLLAAYLATYPTASATTIGAPAIQASKTPGYAVASLDAYGSNGETKLNLYRQGTGAWQVANTSWYNDPHQDGDILPNCTDFDSLTATREAFAGLSCYDSDLRAMSVVGS